MCTGIPLKIFYQESLEAIKKAQSKVLEVYAKDDLLIGHLVQKFNFPDEIKNACEQYLLYFTEFLRDIGLKATSGISEKDGDVIFSVKPQDKEDALEKIANLLKVYLYLPSSPIANSYQNTLESSLSVQRLSSQIQHLNSQLTLANATIQQQNFLMNQQNQVIQSQQFTSQILIDSIKVDMEDEEPLIAGLVKVKDYEIGPLNLSLPQLLRWLKERFGGS